MCEIEKTEDTIMFSFFLLANAQRLHTEIRVGVMIHLIHYQFNTATAPNRRGYSEEKKQKTRGQENKLTESLRNIRFAFTLRPRGIWLPICNKGSFADV